MKTNKNYDWMIGRRIRLIYMNDPYPILPEAEGTIYHADCEVINVNWDNGRNLGVIIGVDKYEIL